MKKDSKNVEAYGLVEPLGSHESIKRFHEELMAVAYARDQRCKDMASKVFDAASNYPADNPELKVAFDPETRKFTISNPLGDALDAVIGTCLNHQTIGYLIELIQVNHESAKQAARAIKKHSENRAMKVDVFVWLDANMVKFKSMDSAAETIAKNVAPIAFRTARDWTGEWKKLRSTGTP